MALTRMFTRDEAARAFCRAVGEVRRLAGEDPAIDLIPRLAMGASWGNRPFTLDQVTGVWSAAADSAKGLYNPGQVETSDSIRSDSCGDLIVNLASGFLINPAAVTDDVIADQWCDLAPVSFDGFEVWNQHSNGLGDYCPWSGQQVTQQNREMLTSGLDPDDDGCPQACPASTAEDPPVGSVPYKAAIVATVKEWVS